MKIELRELTTCGVRPGGDVIELNFIDETGLRRTLNIPFERAQAIAMTLPQLLTKALRCLTGRTEMRYVFPLTGWRVEAAGDQTSLIMTLAAGSGFEVCFGVTPPVCHDIARALKVHVEDTSPVAPLPSQGPLQLN